MMKSVYIGIIILFFSVSAYAQPPDTVWTKKYGGMDQDRGRFVQQTSDGGYIITGETKSFGVGLNDTWLVKTNSMGDTLWTRTYGGSKDENCSCVRQTRDGGYILFTETDSFSPVYWKVWLIKTNAAGDTTWTRLIGDNRHYFVESGQEITEGGYIFTGYTKDSGAGQEDIWLVKTDTSGYTIWSRTLGGSQGDLSHSVQQTNDSGYVVVGTTKSLGSGGEDCWLLRFDTAGDTIWSKVYGGTQDDRIYYVQQTSDNGFILAGETKSFGHANNFYDAWLIKTDALGDTSWTKTYGGTGTDMAMSVQQTLDGGYIIGGYNDSGAWVIKTDSAGDTLWTKSLGWDFGRHIHQTTDGGYILLAESFSNSTLTDAWLVKLEADPNKIDPDKNNTIPGSFILKQNYPNPFNPRTTISWQLAVGSWVNLSLYNLTGQRIAVLVNEKQTAGHHSLEFDASNLASGIYFYRLEITNPRVNSGSGQVKTRKMLLIK